MTAWNIYIQLHTLIDGQLAANSDTSDNDSASWCKVIIFDIQIFMKAWPAMQLMSAGAEKLDISTI